MTRRLTLAALLAAVLLLSGCGYRAVDNAAVGGEAIPGAGTLHVFCDRFGTLVYYTSYANEDEYEAFFAQACVPGTRPIQSTLPIDPAAAQEPWTADGDLGNTQPGGEDQ